MLTIDWKRSPFDFIFQRLLFGETDSEGEITFEGMSSNRLFDKRFTVIPFALSDTPFIITTDNIDRVLNINIQSLTPSLRKRPVRQTSINILNEEQTVLLEIEEGHNFIVIDDPVTGEQAFTVVNARRYATLLFATAQEVFNEVQSRIQEQERAIFNDYATRLVEPLIGPQFDLLPSVKSLQMLAIRLMTKTWTTKGSTEIGVNEMGTALTLNHPFHSRLNKDHKEFDPVRFPLETYQEFFSSQIAHMWIPNFSIVRWKTFMTYINNIKDFSLKDINESELIITNNFGIDERHIFDFDADTEFFEARRQLDLDIITKIETNIKICFIQPGYTFDLFVDAENPLGNCRLTFDSGITFDSDCPFDSEEFDTDHDGYVGLSLIDRNELTSPSLYLTGLGFDSTLCPGFGVSGFDDVVYDLGYYVKSVDIDHTIVDIDATTSGEVRIGLNGVVFLLGLDGGSYLFPLDSLDGGTFLFPAETFDGGPFK